MSPCRRYKQAREFEMGHGNVQQIKSQGRDFAALDMTPYPHFPFLSSFLLECGLYLSILIYLRQLV